MALPFPPHRTHSRAHRIPRSQALAGITAYLSAATTDPSLHPNALLTESGPVTPGANVGLVLHNLHRLRAGLQGRHLAADIPIRKSSSSSAAAAAAAGGGAAAAAVVHDDDDDDEAAAAAAGDSDGGFSGVITPGGNVYASDRPRRAVGDSTKEGDWQDLGEFEREQEEDVRLDGPDDGRGAQGPGAQVVVVGGPVFGMVEEEEVPRVNGYHHVHDEGIRGEETVDRNERKKGKKERKKQVRREEQERRDRERNAQLV